MRVTSSLIGSLDFKLVIYFVFACNLSSRSGDCLLFLLTIDRPLQAYRAVSSDDLHVFSVHRQEAVLHDGLSDLLSQRQIVFTIGLLLRGICILVLLRRVAFSVVALGRVRSSRIMGGRRRLLALRRADHQQRGKKGK